MKRHDSPILERRAIAKGQMIITEGEYGQQAYLIQSGEVKVYLTKEDQEIELARLGAGQIVGEMAFIFDGPRTANVKALTEVNLIVISRQQFESKLQDSDPTIRAIVSMLSRRVLVSNQTLLNNRGDIQDLRDATQGIYENIAARVPKNQLYNLQSTVLPKLQELFEALDRYQERYEG